MKTPQVVQWKNQKVDGLGLKSEQSKVAVTFWEAHKNSRNLPHGLDIYLVNVQSRRKISSNFVCFSESLNFTYLQGYSLPFGHLLLISGWPFFFLEPIPKLYFISSAVKNTSSIRNLNSWLQRQNLGF